MDLARLPSGRQPAEGGAQENPFGPARPPLLALHRHHGQATSSREALERLAVPLVGILEDSINELRLVADKCKADDDAFNFIGANRVIAQIGLKVIEQVQGKKVSMDVNLRSQEDLIQWDSLTPEEKAWADKLFAALERRGAGRK